MTNLKNRSIAALAAILATTVTVGAAAPARAEAPFETVSTDIVASADLDLSTAAGRATMDRRIRQAAVRVCGPLDLSTRTSVIACRSRAIAGANVRLAAIQAGQAPFRVAAAR